MENKKQYTGDYLSLYDYLGHAAGGELGQRIAYEAAKKINNPSYTGRIQMYPNDFLNECKDKGLL